MRRLPAVVAAAAVAVAGGLTTTARADGDPASDVLYFQDVFFPYTAPSADLAAQLKQTVADANKAGFRIKVALIATAQDLGSVPSLFGQQSLYARFLGVELRTFYTHRLLVVMPSGIGVYDAGLPTTKEEATLTGVTVESPDPDGLARAAIAAVEKLRAALGRTVGKDAQPPTIRTFSAVGEKGKVVKLKYTVFDASGRSREVIRVYGPSLLLLATFTRTFAKSKPKRTTAVIWKVPRNLATTKLRFCVLAQDPAGNQRTRCAPVHLT
jgi:hypothetical protein